MIAPTWYPGRRQLRQFAVFSLFGMGMVGFLIRHGAGSLTGASIAWAVGLLIFLIGLPFPDAIRLPYVTIMAVTLPIGWLISNVLLRVIYYGVFTPLGLFFRMVGRDPLILKRPDTESYWRKFPQPKNVDSYYRQS